MKRTIIISDIHGCIDQFNQLLFKINYNSIEDQLILIGDYVDKGPNSKSVVDRVIELVRNHNAIALRGNHDQRLYDLIYNDSNAVRSKFIEHGGLKTLQSYCNSNTDIIDLNRAIETIRTHYQHHLEFLGDLPLYHEDKDHIYVHAGLNPNYKDWRNQPERDFMYIKEEFIKSNIQYGKNVIFGHTRTSDIHEIPDIWFSEGKIGIDGGCAYGMQLNCLIFQNGTYKSEHTKWN
ncbi:metallophosphoesterase family protein [Paenibacillus sp. JCM 10914]|uniref:metallophosphoesterase family protein n=1 Tax=Paenibacillus sp. JCM 10914 TaxID=1236974 RepID=UPI0003CCACDF|nr:metallophosphoesterase family protein [Paenibacillus sp. JCM 10914]GAE06777.1 serine/threonine protein phosphatase [Paenibacillus sp. JCM 10914]